MKDISSKSKQNIIRSLIKKSNNFLENFKIDNQKSLVNSSNMNQSCLTPSKQNANVIRRNFSFNNNNLKQNEENQVQRVQIPSNTDEKFVRYEDKIQINSQNLQQYLLREQESILNIQKTSKRFPSDVMHQNNITSSQSQIQQAALQQTGKIPIKTQQL
ncbi:hypothetical protein TTHERM_001192479 (macronuclear) [Tetrahymena thermophila SB210]|uniref:Uncharacterized protein n=1 Tax=Tetrahymena thermophila (strain SB210) TaxID=312017 RepID=W7XIX8_TETTS|nr:hypothetical protein TTHERM_001192479 [Tetrahymena thermophila SB210]EWS75021.1 hypothetical protein TTHERM_001192479 [Tetrahymena thermophila SB210]|eukprot:XP_012652445.1 hypothetical protein TTHERM_001192479 [Tetrahymena thermophila SB210]